MIKFDKGELIWFIDQEKMQYISVQKEMENKLEWFEWIAYESFELTDKGFVLESNGKTIRVEADPHELCSST